MNRVLLSLLILSVLPAALSAKGATVKIVITGAGLSTPLEITDPNIVDFNIWSGPGCSHDDGSGGEMIEETEGFIIDWSNGIVADMPTGLQHFEVLFFTMPKDDPPKYVVLYEYDPSKEQAFVYLPGESDELFRFNHAMWHGHGYEGHWLRATPAWESFVRPRIAKAVSR